MYLKHILYGSFARLLVYSFAHLQETTAATLNWAVAFLIRYPEAQRRLHDELNNVIGSTRLITVEDRTKLHYTQAVIMV